MLIFFTICVESSINARPLQINSQLLCVNPEWSTARKWLNLDIGKSSLVIGFLVVQHFWIHDVDRFAGRVRDDLVEYV